MHLELPLEKCTNEIRVEEKGGFSAWIYTTMQQR
jgi:hypothetical protein